MAVAVLLAAMATGPQRLDAMPSTTVCAGQADGFACPHESAVRDTGVERVLSTQYSGSECFGFLDFDDIPGTAPCGQPGSTVPKGFLDQRLAFTVPAGGVTAASIQFRVRAGPVGETQTDCVAFFKGSTFLTGSLLKNLPGASGTWGHGQDATFSLDLGHLPSSFPASTILPQLQDGSVDVVIGNETGVDWMCLTIGPGVLPPPVPASDARGLAVLAAMLVVAGAWAVRGTAVKA